MKGYLYLLRSKNCRRPYLGASSDPYNRVTEHNLGTTKSTKNKGPWEIIKVWGLVDIQEAKRIERLIKNSKLKLTEELVSMYVESSSDG